MSRAAGIGMATLGFGGANALTNESGAGFEKPRTGLSQRLDRSSSELVLLEGIELSTSPLPRECSTTELQQRPA
jgi:hypothetical protein